MKRFIFISILLTAFCSAVLAQSDSNPPEIRKIDEYENGKILEASMRVDRLFMEMKSGDEGVIRVQAKTRAAITGEIKQLVKALSFRKYDLKRVTFAVVMSGPTVTQYWLISEKTEMPDCTACMMIRAEDYRGLERFFRSNSKK